MRILDTFIKQRAADKKFMLLGKILDFENTYRYKNEFNRVMSIVPNKWIILDVQDTVDELKKGKYFGKTSAN